MDTTKLFSSVGTLATNALIPVDEAVSLFTGLVTIIFQIIVLFKKPKKKEVQK